MDYKSHLKPLAIFNVISWTTLALVLIRLEPCLTYSSTNFCDKASSLALILFYASLFFALTSTFILIGFLSRVYLNNNEVFAAHYNISVRQGILFSISIIACLGLMSFNILKWWTTLIVFGMVLLIEFYFLNKET